MWVWVEQSIELSLLQGNDGPETFKDLLELLGILLRQVLLENLW